MPVRDARRLSLTLMILCMLAAVYCVLCTAYCSGAEPPLPVPDPQPAVKIAVPLAPIGAGVAVQLPVDGLKTTDLPIARVGVWPREKVTLVPARPWGDGSPFVWFVSGAEGSYLLWIACPRDGGLAYAEAVLVVGKPTPPPPPPEPAPVNPHRPAQQYQELLAPVTRIRLAPSDARSLSSFLAGLKAVVVAGGVGTTADLRGEIAKGSSAVQLGAKYPALAVKLEEVFTATLTLKNVPLDKAEAAALLETTAWAVWEAGK